MGKGLILLGVVLVVAGLVVIYAPGLFSWFGKLPGDIRHESGNGRIFIPLTSMLVVSLILTLLLNVLGRH